MACRKRCAVTRHRTTSSPSPKAQSQSPHAHTTPTPHAAFAAPMGPLLLLLLLLLWESPSVLFVFLVYICFRCCCVLGVEVHRGEKKEKEKEQTNSCSCSASTPTSKCGHRYHKRHHGLRGVRKQKVSWHDCHAYPIADRLSPPSPLGHDRQTRRRQCWRQGSSRCRSPTSITSTGPNTAARPKLHEVRNTATPQGTGHQTHNIARQESRRVTMRMGARADTPHTHTQPRTVRRFNCSTVFLYAVISAWILFFSTLCARAWTHTRATQPTSHKPLCSIARTSTGLPLVQPGHAPALLARTSLTRALAGRESHPFWWKVETECCEDEKGVRHDAVIHKCPAKPTHSFACSRMTLPNEAAGMSALRCGLVAPKFNDTPPSP